jgi:hypothetical protein
VGQSLKLGLTVELFVVTKLSFFHIGGNMAKKNSKRREWTKTDVRELKTLAREKTPAEKSLGHLRGPKVQLGRRLSALEFRWIPVPRIVKQ